MTYPRDLTKNFEPFNPLELTEKTERLVIRGNQRKYNLFRIEPFYGQLATARGIGCNLRCGFCWINSSRDFPEKYGRFYSPQEVYEKLIKVSSNEFGRAAMSEGFRISGCEPTLGMGHLLSLIELGKKENDFKFFLLETNGISLGYNEENVKSLKQFGNYLIVRLSFKAGTPEAFERKTGAQAEYFDLPFIALEYLKEHSIPYRLASMSKDPCLMPPNERRSLLERLASYGFENLGLLEEEKADPFGITKSRLIKSGLVHKPEKLRESTYELLETSIQRAQRGNENPSQQSLKELFSAIEFKTMPSPCAKCCRKNLWHGPGIMDDLDDKLK